MCDFEPIGFPDPDAVEQHLKKLFANASYYDQLTFTQQTRMCYRLSSDKKFQHLRISVDLLLFDLEDLLDLLDELGKHYDYRIVPVIMVPMGKSLDDILFEFNEFAQRMAQRP